MVSWILRSDGEELAAVFKVESIVILNETNRIPEAKIWLLDGNTAQLEFTLSNLDFFKPGRTIEIGLGFDGNVQPVFKGLVVSHGLKIADANALYLEIVCKHPAVKLSVSRHNRFYCNQSDKEALSSMLSEAGVPFDINGLEDYVNEQLVQYESTSWDFMLSRVDVNGHLLFFDYEKLHIAPPAFDDEPILNCLYGANVLGFNAIMDCESQFSPVESKSWSSTDQEVLKTTGTPRFNNTAGNISSDDLAAVLNNGPFCLQHTANLPDNELAAWANTQATKTELSKIQGSVRISGNAEVFPGKWIRLEGFGDRFSGKALVTGVRHEVSNGSWITDIRFGLPAKGYLQPAAMNAAPAAAMLPAVNGVQLGTVTQLEDDPDGEYRIKVRIPMISDEEDGIWAKLVKSYAGNDYGICFLPETGDEVAICFLNDDPRKPMVLGVLHSSAKPAPLHPDDNNYLKGIVSKNNLQILWDDDKKSIRISTPAGHEIVLDEDEQKVTITDMHRNRITMDSNGILIDSSKGIQMTANQDIELEGHNIAIKAKAQFKAEGAFGAELKTDGTAVLKGSLVQIN